ncbi:MAG: TIGR02147 family protein [Chitinispirillaceae bacterium]
MPSVYDYIDYRKFLRDAYEFRKKKNRGFSQRYIVMKVGASSSGWFSDLVNSRINLTRTHLVNLCRVFGLSQNESEYFEELVNYCQAVSFEDKNRTFQKMLGMKDVNKSLVSREQFEYFSSWYFTAIRELLLTYDFKDDYRLLARMLDPPITPSDAKNAIEVLRSLGLVRKNCEGYFKPVERTIIKDSAFKSVHWGNFISSMIRLAMESINRHEASQRDLSAVTMGFSAEKFENAKSEIAKLRKKLLALSEQDKNHEMVYQCNIQLFPLTRKGRK